MPGDVLGRLKTLSRLESATLFMVLLAAFKVLLMRYCGQEDIVVGTPVAGRNRPEVEGLIGYFVNTVALRTDLSGNPSFRDALGRVRHTTLGALDHADLPFDQLVADLSPQRDMSRNPLYQVAFVLNPAEQVLQLPGLQSRLMPVHTGTSKFDLSLALSESEGVLKGELEYSTDLFDGSTIARMAGHFRRLLEAIVELTRFRGHLMLMEAGVRNGKDTTSVPRRVSATDDRAGSVRPDAGRAVA